MVDDPRKCGDTMTFDTYSAEFRVEGPRLQFHDVTSLLGLDPSLVIDGGSGPRGRGVRDPVWVLDADKLQKLSGHSCQANLLADKLARLLAVLLPKKSIIDEFPSSWRSYLWCGHFQKSFDGGPDFSSKLLVDLASLGVPLHLRTYHSR